MCLTLLCRLFVTVCLSILSVCCLFFAYCYHLYKCRYVLPSCSLLTECSSDSCLHESLFVSVSFLSFYQLVCFFYFSPSPIPRNTPPRLTPYAPHTLFPPPFYPLTLPFSFCLSHTHSSSLPHTLIPPLPLSLFPPSSTPLILFPFPFVLHKIIPHLCLIFSSSFAPITFLLPLPLSHCFLPRTSPALFPPPPAPLTIFPPPCQGSPPAHKARDQPHTGREKGNVCVPHIS